MPIKDSGLAKSIGVVNIKLTAGKLVKSGRIIPDPTRLYGIIYARLYPTVKT